MLEHVYEECMALELEARRVPFKRQLSLPIEYRNEVIENAFRVDFLIDGALILELKAVETVLPVHRAQILTYLRLSRLRLGLLINFNVLIIKAGIQRFAR